MKKKELEKAIELFERIPGATLVDNYISKLYKEEIDELVATKSDTTNYQWT